MTLPKRTSGAERKRHRRLQAVLALLAVGSAAPAAAGWFERHEPTLVVDAPFIEMHTGPGRGYPVFYVAADGDRVTVLKRRTNWFKIRGPRDKEGWVHVDQLRHTVDTNGDPIDFGEVGLAEFRSRRWETGVMGGDFDGARTLSVYGAFALTPNIGLQLEATQILGDFSDGVMGTASILMHPFPAWRVSPYFTIGSGIVNIRPQTTVVQAEDRTDEIVHVGAGANLHLTDRFVLRVEYKRHTVLTSRDDNEEIDQWKAGFSVFF
ncbi:MAG TPA: SH3 domain-containing protein [Pseudomonadales bacterium]